MKIVIQRVTHAQVDVDGKTVGSIGPGVLVLVGITHGDTEKQAKWLANKLVHLRIFEDGHGKINQSLLESKGEVLAVSQFTLYADCSGGRRPSFIQAAQPEIAKQLCETFVEEVHQAGVRVQTGVFGAEMKVSLQNNGPVTIILERSSEE